MSEIANAMNHILNGNAQSISGDIVAIAKVLEAYELLNSNGYTEEAELILSILKPNKLEKSASSNIQEEVLFEINE